MKLRSTILLLFILVFQLTSAQKNLNEYAYLIVPFDYEFLDSEDEYQLNSLTKFLFEKEGMVSFFDTEKIPQKYILQECAGLKLKVVDKSNTFKSKLRLELYDCNNMNVFTSDLGVSLEKDFKKSYQEALRNAFKSFSELNYEYAGVPVVETAAVSVATVSTSKGVLSGNTYLVHIDENEVALEVSDDGKNYVGTVKSSQSKYFAVGTIVCELQITSLPNVFKAKWKNGKGEFVDTTAYLDDSEDLSIDIQGPEGISVLKLKKQ